MAQIGGEVAQIGGEVAQIGGEVALRRRGSSISRRGISMVSAPQCKSVFPGSNPAPPQHTENSLSP